MKPTKMVISGALDKDGNDEQATRSEFERLLQQEKQTVHPNITNSINILVSTPFICLTGQSFTNDDLITQLMLLNLPTKPTKVIQALEDPSWIEAMQEELLTISTSRRFGTLVNLPNGQRGYNQEEGIDYDEVFAPFARIEEIRLFLAYASFMGFIMYQMDVKSAFLYGTIDEEVKKKDDGIFISQDKNVADILKKFDFAIVKTASTPIETNKALLKDEEAQDVDVHLYRSMIGSLMYLTASRPDIMFAICAWAWFHVTPKVSHLYAVKRIFRYLKGGCQFLGKRLISWQCKKHTIVANSTTEVEYVAAANCCGQVLWIQNQMLDYGFNFMNTKIYIDNESTICIVIKIHTDQNVADLLTKAFDVGRFQYLIATANDEIQVSTVGLPYYKGKDFSGRVTLLFASMLAPPVVGDEGSRQPSEPQPPSSTTQPIIEEQITVTELSSPKNTQSPRQALQKETQLPQTSVPIPNVVDETEIGSGDRPRCQEAMGVPFLELGGLICRSDEGRPNINELMVICTNLSNRVLALEQSKTAQDLVINKLQKKVKRLEKALRARTPGMNLFTIGTSRRKGLDKENVSRQGRKSHKTKPMFKDSDFDVLDDAIENVEGGSTTEQITTTGDTLNTASINVSTAGPSNGSAVGPSTSTTGDIFEDEMTTIADTLVAIRSARPRTTSIMVEPEPTPKNPRKAHIQMDEELAQRLFKEEQAQFEREQRIARERAAEQEAKDAALIEQMEVVQARMDANELLALRLQEQEREQFSIDEQARFLVETIAARKKFFATQRAAEIRNKPPTKTQLRNQMIAYLKHMGNDDSGNKDDSSSKQAESSKNRPIAEHDEESVKKQKLQDDAKKEELRACLDIVQEDDITIDVESLATKYPIVDWKTHILTENMMYYQIIRADGSSKNYKIFSEMLDDFDRQDVMDLHRLMKSGGINKANLISWRLFDSCGIHVLLMDNGIAIHMMKEKKYPLTQEMLSRMLNRRLEVDHESEMAFDLLRFTRSQLKKGGLLGIRAFYNLMLLVQVCAAAED
ncbi:putative ribonuclease H-like domain-containing protein [Tanacetum coccineum]